MTQTLEKPMFSNRELFRLGIPMVLEGLLSVAAGMADVAMVSSCGAAAMSAVSLIDPINNLFTLFFGAMTLGGIIVTSQYLGRGDTDRAKSSAYQVLYGSTAVALVITVILLCFIPQVIKLIYGELEPLLFEKSKTYFFWTLLSYPFLAIASSCSSVLRVQKKTTATLISTLLINTVNIGGNAVLIYGFDMDIAGAAISTTLCRVVWALLGLSFMRNSELPIRFAPLFKYKPDFDILKRILKLGGANGLENVLLQFGTLLITTIIAALGTTTIAANSAANFICNFGWLVPGQLGGLLLMVVGRCMGAGRPDEAKAYTKKIANFSLVFTLFFFGILFLLRNQVVHVYALEEEALALAGKVVGIVCLATILSFFGWAGVPTSAFRAAGDVKYTVIVSVSTTFICRIGLAYVFSRWLNLGILGVWIGNWMAWTTSAVSNCLRLRSGKWMTKKVI